MPRRLISSGSRFESDIGYSRAVVDGDWVFVSGTTATDENGEIVGRDDPEAQARYIIEKIGRALAAVGASLADVVRTRIYLERADDWEAVGRAHAHYFGQTRPANTLVEVSDIIGDGYLLEIDADAVIAD